MSESELCGNLRPSRCQLLTSLAREWVNTDSGVRLRLARAIENFAAEYSLKARLASRVHTHSDALDLFVGGNLDSNGLPALGFQLCVNGIHNCSAA